MKIIAGAFIDSSKINIEEFFDNFKTYIFEVDKAIIYDFHKEVNNEIKERIENNFIVQFEKEIEYLNVIDYGEAENYHKFLETAAKEKYQYALIMESGYYYEEDNFKELVNYLKNTKDENISVLTPFPLYTCMKIEERDQEYREIKGAHLVGTLINVDHYAKIGPFKLEYYQGYVDYEYCLRVRLVGNKVVLANHLYIWNQNFNLIERTIMLQKFSTYEKPIKELYYETRNRHYLWKEYQGIDDEYVKADKRSFKREVREIKFIDPQYELKREVIRQAKRDYRKNIKYKSDMFK